MNLGSPRRKKVTLAGIVLSLLIGMFLGVSGYTFEAAKGLSYLSDDPRTCVNCHIMREQYDSWQKSSHHAVATCNSCHVPHDPIGKWLVKGEHGIRHSWAFTFQNFPEPIQARQSSRDVVEHNCRDCHSALVSEMAQLGDHHRGSTSCLHCHGKVGHGASYSTNN